MTNATLLQSLSEDSSLRPQGAFVPGCDVVETAPDLATFRFRLTANMDPEERLEEAALFKAMHDAFGGSLVAVDDAFQGPIQYGRRRRFSPEASAAEIDYWNDPAFLRAAKRDFAVVRWEDAGRLVADLHARGKGAFVKSTRAKHCIFRVPVGATLEDEADAMVFSFIDGGPRVMVQEMVEFRREHRFFVVGRKVVSDSPNAAHLTPLDYPMFGQAFETPGSREPVDVSAEDMMVMGDLAAEIAATMQRPDAVIDLAWIGGTAACVEINPLVVGGVGLFASDVRALAKAIYQRDCITALSDTLGRYEPKANEPNNHREGV